MDSGQRSQDSTMKGARIDNSERQLPPKNRQNLFPKNTQKSQPVFTSALKCHYPFCCVLNYVMFQTQRWDCCPDGTLQSRSFDDEGHFQPSGVALDPVTPSSRPARSRVLGSAKDGAGGWRDHTSWKPAELLLNVYFCHLLCSARVGETTDAELKTLARWRVSNTQPATWFHRLWRRLGNVNTRNCKFSPKYKPGLHCSIVAAN